MKHFCMHIFFVRTHFELDRRWAEQKNKPQHTLGPKRMQTVKQPSQSRPPEDDARRCVPAMLPTQIHYRGQEAEGTESTSTSHSCAHARPSQSMGPTPSQGRCRLKADTVLTRRRIGAPRPWLPTPFASCPAKMIILNAAPP